MTAIRVLGDIDLVSLDDLRSLGSAEGSCLSVFMPTHRSGADTLQGGIRLGNLVEKADRELDAVGMAKRSRASLLAPLRELVDDSEFWQHQADGLALFASPGWFSKFRVALPLPEEATVSSRFRIRPLLPIVSGDGAFLLLALTENTVRLFETTRHSIAELDLGPIPGSKAEALWYEDPERQLQYRSGGDSAAEFHGHGLGDEVRKAELERYLRTVDKGLRQRVGQNRRPLILACVGYYEPIFRSVSDYPGIVDQIVEGSPERLKAEELHAKAWPVIESLQTAAMEKAIDLYHELAGTGRTATDIGEIVEFAAQGRVDTLLIAEDAPEQWGSPNETSRGMTVSEQRQPFDHDMIDLAAAETLEKGGVVQVTPGSTGDGVPVAAILRY